MKFNTQEEQDAYVEDLETALTNSRSSRASTTMSNAALRAELVEERRRREKAETDLEVARSQWNNERRALVKRTEKADEDLLKVTEALRIKTNQRNWLFNLAERVQAELESAQADAETQRERVRGLEREVDNANAAASRAGNYALDARGELRCVRSERDRLEVALGRERGARRAAETELDVQKQALSVTMGAMVATHKESEGRGEALLKVQQEIVAEQSRWQEVEDKLDRLGRLLEKEAADKRYWQRHLNAAAAETRANATTSRIPTGQVAGE